MKANAPEKLYLSKNIYSTYLYQVPDPDDETAIEYIRTDAFIEKALAYLNEKFYFNNAFYGVVSTDFNAMEELFDDFRKYMEGE